MTTPKILVTTATGTTGSALVRQLSAAGIAARALTRSASKAFDLPHIETIVGDLGNPASLKPVFEGVESVYLNVVPGPDALDQIDNALAAAMAAGVSKIAKLSGLYATADSPSAIIRMHAEADARLQVSGMAYCILRANSFFQNTEGQLDGIKAQGQFYLAMGDARQSLIDVDDIAAIAIRFFTSPALDNRILDVTGPESLTYHDVATKLAAALGKAVTYVPISSEAFAESLRSTGMPDAAVTPVVEIFALFASGVYAEPTGDVRQALGREPTRFDAYAKRLLG